MRIRTIKPEFFLHEGLFEAELTSQLPLRVAFAGLWCAADREGRFKWKPRQLGIQILPYDNVEFSRVLDALVTRGFVVKYTSEGCEYGVIPGFKTHQIINNRETPSNLPPPTLEALNQAGSDACGTREPREGHADTGERKGKEGKGREYIHHPPAAQSDGVCVAEPPARSGKTPPLRSADIEAIYQAYPRHVGKEAALKAIRKVLERTGMVPGELLEVVQRYAAAVKRSGTEPRFVPHPASWMNAGRYADDPREWEAAAASPGGGEKKEEGEFFERSVKPPPAEAEGPPGWREAARVLFEIDVDSVWEDWADVPYTNRLDIEAWLAEHGKEVAA